MVLDVDALSLMTFAIVLHVSPLLSSQTYASIQADMMPFLMHCGSQHDGSVFVTVLSGHNQCANAVTAGALRLWITLSRHR